MREGSESAQRKRFEKKEEENIGCKRRHKQWDEELEWARAKMRITREPRRGKRTPIEGGREAIAEERETPANGGEGPS